MDDVPANLVAMEAALEPLRRPIVKARSGLEALGHLLEYEFALVLLDLHMPNMDGFETATLIRSRELTKHLPIIFCTADSHPGVALHGYRLGAVDFLVKPLQPEVLRAKASVFLALDERTEQLAHEKVCRAVEHARIQHETAMLRRDVEREKDAAAELAALNTALTDSVRRKDEMLAIVAHELRNPLMPIRTAIDLAKLRPEEPLDRRTLQALDRQTLALTRMVDDLMDVSRVRVDKLTLHPRRQDLRDILEEAIATSRDNLEQRRHRLIVELAPDPVLVDVDQVRIVQVLANVLNNAARYTERGGTITVTCGASDGSAVVRVVDTGIGIAPELLPRIFEMFVQERARPDGSGGLGLGLALARQLVDMHGGSIRCFSAGRGAGSTFDVVLPSAPSLAHNAIPPVAAVVNAQAREGRPCRTLIVDDDADALELLAELLRSRGHHVLTAEDGDVGLGLACEHQPDVALVDLGLPGMSGLDLVRRLRDQHPSIETRLVALTGHAGARELENARAAGFHAHLVKPASSRANMETIEALLRAPQDREHDSRAPHLIPRAPLRSE